LGTARQEDRVAGAPCRSGRPRAEKQVVEWECHRTSRYTGLGCGVTALAGGLGKCPAASAAPVSGTVRVT